MWHGGAKIADDNEINGVTFGGVGSGTVVDHCEVAFNKDDGFEFFGGTVNVKYLSVLFVGDDAFDTDEGYQGKGQFLFTMLGEQGNHGTEMDSKYENLPRSHPQFYGMTIVGSGSSGRQSAGMRLREGTGGKFGNVVMANLGGVHSGVENKQCTDGGAATSLVSTQDLSSVDASDLNSHLFFSSNNIIHDASTDFVYSDTCTNLGWTAVTSNPMLMVGAGTESNDVPIDPRPACGSPAYSDVDSVPDAFFTDVSFKGAFGADNWLDGWSIINTRSGFVSTRRNTMTCETQYDTLCGDISSNLDLVRQPCLRACVCTLASLRPGLDRVRGVLGACWPRGFQSSPC